MVSVPLDFGIYVDMDNVSFPGIGYRCLAVSRRVSFLKCSLCWLN